MRVDELFEVQYGNGLALNALERSDPDSGIAFVSRSAQNNGVAAWVKRIDKVEPFHAGSLTVALRSRNHAVATFLQPRPFYTAYHLFVLTPRKEMSDEEKLWWAMCIEENRYRYHFGRQANRTLPSLQLPAEPPAWVKATSLEALLPDSGEPAALPPAAEWGAFRVDSLFQLTRGKNLVRRDMAPGKTPYVSASAQNNGVTALVAAAPQFEAGCITVSNNGSVGESFYQPRPFLASADVSVLRPRAPLSEGAALFVCTTLMAQRPLWNYGRKWTPTKLAATTIALPVTAQGEPDWATMERFVGGLPLSEALGVASTGAPAATATETRAV